MYGNLGSESKSLRAGLSIPTDIQGSQASQNPWTKKNYITLFLSIGFKLSKQPLLSVYCRRHPNRGLPLRQYPLQKEMSISKPKRLVSVVLFPSLVPNSNFWVAWVPNFEVCGNKEALNGIKNILRYPVKVKMKSSKTLISNSRQIHS